MAPTEASSETFDVLIIGCGPVGLYAAYLLGRCGITTLIIDKHTTRRGQPKAHALNPRTLEIFKQTGLDPSYIRNKGIDPRQVDVVRIVSSFYGWEFGQLPYERQFDDVKNLTPEPLVNVAQPLVEEYLADQVAKLPSVTVRRGVEWLNATSIEVGGQKHVQSVLRNREDAQESNAVSRFLIACDGARAASRVVLNIGFNPVNAAYTTEKHHVTTHFEAALTGKRTGILFFTMQPHGVRAFIRYGENEWVYVRRYDPETTSTATFDDATCREMIFEALGRPEDVKILSTTLWTSSTKVADHYTSASVPNAFLAGDAAHTFPPTGGLGVNTGVGDVHNLVWKLVAVLNGTATDELLQTYETERRPVAVRNAQQSALNEANMDRLGQTINPKGIQDGDGSNIDWEDAKFKETVAQAIALNAQHFNSLALQLGYVYGESKDLEAERAPVSDFVPRAVPGSRLPHVYISSAGPEKSILDLLSYVTFTLICPSSALSESFQRMVASGLPLQLSKMLKVVVHGLDFEVKEGSWTSMVFGTSMTRAVLVRPDQHVAGFPESMDAVVELLRSTLYMSQDI
ncbi:hypothetical protein SBRCBS47491_007040 [Sporothrix bragantina]|uniref:FAD-binding domain-containing protein n=1 Tax=Sporothrix bragantina TaxID=671064 RepID=A0ABP0C9W7_9PEZI